MVLEGGGTLSEKSAFPPHIRGCFSSINPPPHAQTPLMERVGAVIPRDQAGMGKVPGDNYSGIQPPPPLLPSPNAVVSLPEFDLLLNGDPLVQFLFFSVVLNNLVMTRVPRRTMS